MLYDLARSALFCLDAERSHDLTLSMMQKAPALVGAMMGQARINAQANVMGLKFPNRIGLAAGLDKNALCLPAWERLGFGFIEVGTVTPRPQAGNPKPRMFRLPEHRAIINRLGFNNLGMESMAACLQAQRSAFTGVFGINIGKNADTPIADAANDYIACLARLHQFADYITVNISSPNTKNLRDLQSPAALADLLSQIEAARQRIADTEGRRAPLLVKIAPDVDAEQIQTLVRIAQAHRVDGIIATNTTISRQGVEVHEHAKQAGGLSGQPLLGKAQATLETLRAEAGPDFTLIGVGGISSASDALARRQGGADLVQIYSSFIYQGPPLVANIAAALR